MMHASHTGLPEERRQRYRAPSRYITMDGVPRAKRLRSGGLRDVETDVRADAFHQVVGLERFGHDGLEQVGGGREVQHDT